MTLDRNKAYFFTGDPVDMVVNEGSISIANDGATGSSPQTAKIVETRIANPYGKKAMCRFRYSVDGGASYNGQDAHVVYTYTYTYTPAPFTQTLGGLKAAVSVGVSASEIIFRTANGWHGNVTDNGVTISYTPNALTFLIDYSIFEVGV